MMTERGALSLRCAVLCCGSFLPLPPYEGEQTVTHMINAGGGRWGLLACPLSRLPGHDG